MPADISMTLAAMRQAAAIGGYGSKPTAKASPGSPAPASPPVIPAKPPGMGLLVDTRA